MQSALVDQEWAIRAAKEAASQWTAKRGDLVRRIQVQFEKKNQITKIDPKSCDNLT